MDEIRYEKEYIRVFLLDENHRQITYDRDNELKTSVDLGYEDLSLKEDAVKINLYQTAEKIILANDKTYRVESREFMPCRPVCLYLYLKEV